MASLLLQPPRRTVPGQRLPTMAGNPRPPSPSATRRRSPRTWPARPNSAPIERAETARQVGEPKVEADSQPHHAQPPGRSDAQRGRRPVSAPQFRRGRAVSVAAQQPDRSGLKTPADGTNRPKTPAAPAKTARQRRPESALDFQAAKSDRSGLKTPLDGMNRPNSSPRRYAPTKTPPTPETLDNSVLGPMDSRAEVRLPLTNDPADADASQAIWEPSLRTMDELDAEVMQVTGVAGDGPPSTAESFCAPVQPKRTAVMRPQSAPQIPRPSSAKAGAFVERSKSSLGRYGSAAANSSAVTPRRLAALQQEVRQMKAEKINPTPTKSRKPQGDLSILAVADASKPAPSSGPAKKCPARPATKTKSLKHPTGLAVQVKSPNGERGSDAAEFSSSTYQEEEEMGDTTPATTVGDGTPPCPRSDSPEDAINASLGSESFLGLWAAADTADTSSAGELLRPSANGPSSTEPIVVVDSRSTADALQELLRRVDDLRARLTTSEREKLQLSAKVKLLQSSAGLSEKMKHLEDGRGTRSSSTGLGEQESLVQNQLVDLEMEKQHLEHTTDGLRCLMDSVERTWKEKCCKLAAQSMLRGSALEQLQAQGPPTAAVTAGEEATCGRCSSVEEELHEWREKARSLEAELLSAQSSEATARKQMAAAVSSLEKFQEEHELTVSSLRAQAAASLEQEQSTVVKLREQLRSERRAAAAEQREISAAKTQSESLVESQRAARTAEAEAELQAEREQRQQMQQQAARTEEQIAQLQFRLSANETELLQSEHARQQSQETLAKTEVELARSTQVASAATLRIQELESELRAVRDAAGSPSPREIALSASQAGDAILIQHLKDEAAQLRARLVAVEVGAQEVAEEKAVEIKQLRAELSTLQMSSESTGDLKRKKDSAALAGAQPQQQNAILAEDVSLSIQMSTQNAKDVAEHSNQLVRLATSVEEVRELMESGADTAMDLHGHVQTLQELVVGQQQLIANLASEHAAGTVMADGHQLQLMLSQPPAGAARVAVRAKQVDATHPAFSPMPSPAAPSAQADEEADAAATAAPPSSFGSDTQAHRHTGTGTSGSKPLRRSGLQQRSRNGNSARDKHDSMRHALRQLKRELSKVQDSHVARRTQPEDAAAAQLRKQSSGGYTLGKQWKAGPTEEGGAETVTIGGALAAAAATAAARDRRPAKLSTLGGAEKNGSQSLLRMR